jgi:GT2 family glycosyltransferase
MLPLSTPDLPVVVVILTINQREKTLRCLASLRAVTGPPFGILLWDNGSTDGTPEAVQAEFPEVYVHHSPANLGVASGRNAAAALATQLAHPKYLAFLDNDIVVEPGYLDALVRSLEADARVGQAQAKLRLARDPERLNDGGGNRIQFWLGRTRPVGFGEIDRGQYDQPVKCVSCGGAMIVRTDLFHALGGFDPIFNPFGPEDLDFSLRLARAGYDALYVPDAVAFHEVSHTFGDGSYSERYARHKVRHWFVFMRRHASLAEQIAFVFMGAPYRLTRLLFREGKRGNLAAARGVARGALDYATSLVRRPARMLLGSPGPSTPPASTSHAPGAARSG